MTFSSTAPEQLTSLLAAQKKAFVGAGHVSAELRRERIQRVIELLVRFQQPLVEAMDADFGGRPQGFSLMNDVLGPWLRSNTPATITSTGLQTSRARCLRPMTSWAPRPG